MTIKYRCYFIFYTLFIIIFLSSQCPASSSKKLFSPKKAQSCIACHGMNGNSTSPLFPKIAGQNKNYLIEQLLEYKKGTDKNGQILGERQTELAQQMITQVQTLSKQDIYALAEYYSSFVTSKGETEKKFVTRGEQLYRGGDLSKGIPACAACHGPSGMGNDAAKYPKLSGQHSQYLFAQLDAFAEGKRKNAMMEIISKKLSKKDKLAVSSFSSGLY